MAAKTAAPKPPERKTETLSLRIDPKTRYGLELLSRRQRRSATGVVEWLILQALDQELLPNSAGNDWTLAQALSTHLWKVDELPRLLAMATEFPSLLTFEEQRMVAVLFATGATSNNLWTDSRKRTLGTFNFVPALANWDKLKAMLQEAAIKPTVQPLSKAQLEELGYEVLPF